MQLLYISLFSQIMHSLFQVQASYRQAASRMRVGLELILLLIFCDQLQRSRQAADMQPITGQCLHEVRVDEMFVLLCCSI